MADSESDRSKHPYCDLCFVYSSYRLSALTGKINLVDLAGSENNKVGFMLLGLLLVMLIEYSADDRQ